MKKLILPCMLVFSIMTATAVQLSQTTLNSLNDTIITTTLNNIPTIEVVEEEDEPFDFNHKDYLPLGFDPYKTMEEKYGIIYEVSLEEEDEPFDFNTKNYLPVGFNLNAEVINSIEEINIEEVDEPFNFDTKKYLPVGFNATKTVTKTNEL